MPQNQKESTLRNRRNSNTEKGGNKKRKGSTSTTHPQLTQGDLSSLSVEVGYSGTFGPETQNKKPRKVAHSGGSSTSSGLDSSSTSSLDATAITGKTNPNAAAKEPLFNDVAVKHADIAIVFLSNEFKDEIPKLENRIRSNYSQVFKTQICYLDSSDGGVSLRITLLRPEKFFHHELLRHNRMALFSPDLPFPPSIYQLTSAQKVLLLDFVVKRIVYDECHVPLHAEMFIVPFHEEEGKKVVWEACCGFSKPSSRKPSLQSSAPEDLSKKQQRALKRQQQEQVGTTSTSVGSSVAPSPSPPSWLSLSSWFRFQMPIHTIREYYGDQVMFYFAWMNFYNAWLVFPAFTGLGLFLMNYYCGLTNDTNPLVPFYSIVVMLWAIFFVKFWERREHWYSIECDLNHAESAGEVRKTFKGAVRPSPVTGKPELYYPGWKRALKQPVSWILTILFLLFSLYVQVCSLNLQGYMNSKKHERFEIDFWDQFSRPGRVFDPEGDYALVPVVLHSIAVLFLNYVYQKMAETLTSWENYRLVHEHEESLTQKRVFFEFIDCFCALFYVAFYRLDLVLLRQELISLFAVDQLRRLLLESIIPFLTRFGKPFVESLWERVKGRGATTRGKKKAAVVPAAAAAKVEELDQEYEAFDDYLEMVMQFGYITFFAAAFPLAAFLSLVGNSIEIRSDIFKLSFVLRRPSPERCKSIKPWGTVLKIFAVMCVISNTLLFAFTSNQMRQFFPYLYNSDGTIESGDGRFVVATAFVLEHSLLLIVLYILWKIPSMPSRVRTEIERRKYQRMMGSSGSANGSAGGGGTNSPSVLLSPKHHNAKGLLKQL